MTVSDHLQKCKDDTAYFAEKEIRIQASGDYCAWSGLKTVGALIPLRANKPQRVTFDTADVMARAGGLVDINELKSRQVGLSRGILAIILKECAFVPGTVALSMAHLASTVHTHRDDMRTMVEHMPRLGGALHVVGRPQNQTLLSNGSKIRHATGGYTFAAHGETFHAMHISEAARFRKPDEVMKGVMNAGRAARVKIVESTSNGPSGWFYDRWQQGMSLEDWLAAPVHRRRHVNLFFPWYEVEWYALKSTEAAEAAIRKARETRRFEAVIGEGLCSPAEADMVAQFGLTHGQILWARHCLEKECGNDLYAFRQQYPATISDAFAAGGSPVFPMATIESRAAHCREPLMIGNMTPSGFQVCDDGPLWIWELPQAGHTYVLAADPAQGKADGDFSALQVVDVHTRRQVVEFQARIDGIMLADVAAPLGLWYNGAWHAPENAQGSGAYIETMIHKYSTARFFQYRQPERPTEAATIGFPTRAGTRVRLTTQGRAFYSDLTIDAPSERLLSEARTWQWKERDFPKHAEGAHDDVLMAWCIAMWAARDVAQFVQPPSTDRPAPTTKLIPGVNASWRFDPEYSRPSSLLDFPAG